MSDCSLYLTDTKGQPYRRSKGFLAGKIEETRSCGHPRLHPRGIHSEVSSTGMGRHDMLFIHIA